MDVSRDYSNASSIYPMTAYSLKKDYLWNTLGVFAQNAISPLLLIVITRINGIYDSGVFSFAFSVAIIFWALGMWGGRTYQVSDTKKEFSSRSYVMVRLILAIVIILGAIIFVTANHYDAMKSSILIVLVLFKALESIADSLYGVMQVNGRLYQSGKSLTYKSLLGVGVFVVIDILTNDILLGCVGIFVVNAIFILSYDLPRANKLEKLWIKTDQIIHHVEQAIQIIKRCAPVFAVIFLAMFSLNIPRYFIDLYHQEDIGYFGIIVMPITLIVLLMSFILQPNVVGLSRLYHLREFIEFRTIVKKIINTTSVLGFVILALTITIGSQALQLVFGVDFSQHWLALVVIVAGGVINALVSVFINILIMMRLIRVQFYILLTTNILLVFASILIIPACGLIGGAYLFVTVNVVQLFLLASVYRSRLRDKK